MRKLRKIIEDPNVESTKSLDIHPNCPMTSWGFIPSISPVWVWVYIYVCLYCWLYPHISQDIPTNSYASHVQFLGSTPSPKRWRRRVGSVGTSNSLGLWYISLYLMVVRNQQTCIVAMGTMLLGKGQLWIDAPLSG